MRHLSLSYWICMTIILVHSTIGQPIDKASADSKVKLKDEIRYPNGTVVGKYTYTDNDGNPIHVKYYADNTSYGVELNSFKVIGNATGNDSLSTLDKLISMDMDNLNPMEPLLDLASDVMNFHKEHLETPKPVIEGDKNVQSNTVSQISHSVAKSNKLISPDYETYYQNEVKAPKQCEKDKVRVYLVKEKRKTRSLMLPKEDTTKYCEQF